MSSVAFRSATFGQPIESELVAAGDTASAPLIIPALTRGALVSAMGGNAVWRADGVAPTATVGHPLGDGDIVELSRTELWKVRFIAAETGVGVNIFVTYYRD